MILGHHGVRVSAALHLRWDDIDEAAGEVIWRPEFDKVGHGGGSRSRMRSSAPSPGHGTGASTLATGPWVFFSRDARSSSRANGSAKAGVYRIQSFGAALVKAEAKAGVEHLPYRGAHGMRRMVAGEVNAQTGDPVLAMHYIGDTDLNTMKRHLKRRDDRLRAAADTWTTS